MSLETLQSLLVLGCSHHKTPLEVRERFTLNQDGAHALQARLNECSALSESIVLATCNRLEIYARVAKPNSPTDAVIRQLLSKELDLKPEFLDDHLYQYTNLEVIEHAFSVASGLDSQLIGETEILGQMKQAHAAAQQSKSTGPTLNRLFEKSFQAAKIARTQTGIGKGQVSIGNVAVDLASRIFGKFETSRVLLIGSGEVGQRTAQALKSRGVTSLEVTSRTLENAQSLATELEAKTIPFEEYKTQLQRFDIIISSTAAPGLILNPIDFTAARKACPARPFFLIDLAMPRDLDPQLSALENFYLYNLDDLSEIANENLARRSAECQQAQRLLKAQAWQLWLQLRRRS